MKLINWKKSILVFGFVVFAMSSLIAQNELLKALYVNDFVDIIGIPSSEEKLLKYAQDHEFDYLIIYNISKVHRNRFPIDNQMTDDPLAAFISKAKKQYGIKRLSVVGETADSFDPVYQYNLNHIQNKDELVDGFNLEFEFWNSKLIAPEGYYCKTYLRERRLPCGRNGAFYFYLDNLKKLRTKTNEMALSLESYVGNVSKEEMQKLIQYLTTIHIHYYRKDTKKMVKYKSNRIEAIIDGNSKVEVFPIFSSRDKHLKPWLADHDIDEVFPVFMKQLEEDKSLSPIIKNIKGHTWYRYTDMP